MLNENLRSLERLSGPVGILGMPTGPGTPLGEEDPSSAWSIAHPPVRDTTTQVYKLSLNVRFGEWPKKNTTNDVLVWPLQPSTNIL